MTQLPPRRPSKSDKAEKGRRSPALGLPPLVPTANTLVGRFLSYVEQDGDCWLFDGLLQENGYGMFCCDGKKFRAHRIAYELFNGPIPDGLHVLHSCDVRNCVNPKHLSLGTHADNMRDMAAKGRRGGAVGESAPWAKLDETKVRHIRASTLPGTVWAKFYGVSKGAIYAVRNGKTWKAVR